MAQKYLLECASCSKDIEIEPKNAGNQVRCQHCGKMSSAPTMREIRQLPPLDTGEAEVGQASRGSGNISMTARWVFLIGALMLVGGGITGAFLYNSQLGLDTEIPEYRLHEIDRRNLENMGPSAVVEVWDTLKNNDNMDEWTEHPLRKNQRMAATRQTGAMVSLGIAAIGLLSLVGALFMAKR